MALAVPVIGLTIHQDPTVFPENENLIQKIFSFGTFNDLTSLAQVSRKFKKCAYNDRIWKSAYEKTSYATSLNYIGTNADRTVILRELNWYASFLKNTDIRRFENRLSDQSEYCNLTFRKWMGTVLLMISFVGSAIEASQKSSKDKGSLVVVAAVLEIFTNGMHLVLSAPDAQDFLNSCKKTMKMVQIMGGSCAIAFGIFIRNVFPFTGIITAISGSILIGGAVPQTVYLIGYKCYRQIKYKKRTRDYQVRIVSPRRICVCTTICSLIKRLFS